MPLIIEPYRNILSIQNLFSVTTSDVETKAHTAVLASAIGQRIAHTYKRDGGNTHRRGYVPFLELYES